MRRRSFVLMSLMFGLLVCGFAHTALAQVTTACSPTSLCLDNNHFLTGDYAVGGAVLNGPLVNGLLTGTISIPDTLQPNAVTVPVGARVDGARLIWGTVESTQPGAITGQVASFNGFTITGKPLGNPQAPTSWSNGGCSGNSQGVKTMQVYERDVRPFLPLDANGRVQGNGTFAVGFQDSGSNGNGVPMALGGFLVITYSLQSALVPLNSIVIYNGAVAPNNSLSTFTQPIVGFYDAAASPVAKLTILAFNTQANKDQVVSLNGVTLPSIYGTNSAPFPGKYNGSSDAPTWTGTNSPINSIVHPDDFTETVAVTPTTSGGGCPNYGAVILSTTVADINHDGVLKAWKTNVTNGTPNPGYTEAKTGQFVALPGASTTAQDIFVEVDWLCDLTGCDPNASGYLHSHLPKQLALDKVGDAFWKQNIHVHFDVGTNFNTGCKLTPVLTGQGTGCPDPYIVQGGTGGNAIPESAVLCTDPATPTPTTLCPFPGTPTVGWKEGFLFVQNLATVPNSNPPVPLGNFQFGRKDSYHYALFGHALGMPRSFWTTFGNTLPNPSFAKLESITNSGTTATVIIHTPQGIVKPGDCPNPTIPACGDANVDRITIGGALGQPALNGTYHFTNLSSSAEPNNVTKTTFTITTQGVADGAYSFGNESRLSVQYLGPTSTSGHSDFPGGADVAEMFGLWPADDDPGCQPDPSVSLNSGQTYCVNQVGTITAQAGTLLHELGHNFTLAHGGTFFPTPNNPNGTFVNTAPLVGQQANNPPFFARAYGLNCNSGFLSSMNYLFQIRGFPDGGIDYSGQTFSPVDENNLSESNGIGLGVDSLGNSASAPHFTRWYAPPNALDIQLQNTVGGRFATAHCDGTPIGASEPPAVRVDGSTFSAPIDWNNNLIVPDATEPVAWQDVNFNGSTASSADPPSPPAFNDMQGFNDWVNLDLRQIGSRAFSFGLSGGGGGVADLSAGGGVADLSAGGGVADLSAGGGVADLSAGGGVTDLSAGGGVADLSAGGGEQNQETACSTADAPTHLTAVVSNKAVVLNWNAPGGPCQVRRYDVLRATGSFPTLASVLANLAAFKDITLPKGITGTPPVTTFTDPNVKNNTTYTYIVTETNAQGAQSGPSNPTTIFVLFSTK